MKIRRFDTINEAMSEEVKEFVQNFADSTDAGDILDWVDNVVKQTKLKNYPKFLVPTEKTIEFATQNNLKKLLSHITIQKEIDQKEKEIEKLKNKAEKLSSEAQNELMYKFQEDLIINDFAKFNEFFIENDETINLTDEEKMRHTDIHPNILKKYRNKILLSMTSNKYNI